MESFAIALQTKIPVLLSGAPGCGKTSHVYSLCDGMGMPLEVVIASIREPSDFGGLPVVGDGGVTLAAPAWAKRLHALNGSEHSLNALQDKALRTGVRGVLFIDEITTAPPAVQAALLRVVLDRVVGDLALPDCISIVAACNPPEQAAGGWELSPPLANRFVHLSFPLDVQQWVDGFVGGWASSRKARRLPESWADAVPQQKALVAAFIRSRPELLLKVPSVESESAGAWPSPRTWDMASIMLGACAAAGASEEARMQLVCGCVGNGPGGELLTYLDELDLPDPEKLLADPKSFKLPDRGDQQFAVLASVAAAAVGKLTAERWMAAWTVMAAAAKAGAVDVAAGAARNLANHLKDGLPIPTSQLTPFVPLLKAAGLM